MPHCRLYWKGDLKAGFNQAVAEQGGLAKAKAKAIWKVQWVLQFVHRLACNVSAPLGCQRLPRL